MGYLGRRIGLSQDKGDSSPGGADGAVGGGILDLVAQGYFNREGNIYNNPGVPGSGIVATGGAINDYTDSGIVYRSHTFTSSGAFQVTGLGGLDGTVDILSVGGGGGGGYNPPSYGGSGGGAGGVHYRTGVQASVATYPVTIGGGGSAGRDGASTSSPLAPFTAAGGGGGSDGTGSGAGRSGASGGGGNGPGGSGGPATGAPGHPGGTDVVSPSPNDNGWGNAGVAPAPPGYWGDGSGGGGAGGAGSQQSTSGADPGDGGNGVKYSTAYGPTNLVTYAGGGSGGAHNGPITTPAEGRPAALRGGGGGGGGTPSSNNDGDEGDHAVAGTGGGGGGSGNKRGAYYAGNGGSGTFIVRYKIATFQTGTAKATGGLVSYNGGKAYHVFYTTQDFQITNGPVACDFLVVGGGGAGGGGCGGGGGAGGYRSSFPEGPGGPSPSSEAAVTVANGTYTVTVGSGGSKRGVGDTSGPGGSGGFSNIAFPSAIRAEGGGGGGFVGGPGGNGQPGGSGGGGNYPNGTRSSGNRQSPHSGTPVPNQGYPGGITNQPANYGAGGGGGAYAAGADGTTSDGGDGGAGKQNTATGVTLSLAGGGGGNIYYPSSTVGDATHGGGQSAPHAGVAPRTGPTSINGHTNTGGGGGGGLRNGGAGPQTGIPPSIPSANTGVAGQGGSGIVIIAYPL